jgi:hypothetical protein
MRPHPRVLTPLYGASGHSVLPAGQLSASLHRFGRPDVVVSVLALTRVAVGAVFLAAPVLAVRLLGVDTATARRVRFLARMTAARDISLGAGTLAEGATPGAVPWLLASAASDVVDAVAMSAAIRQGAVRRLPGGVAATSAAAAAVLGTWAALRLRRK